MTKPPAPAPARPWNGLILTAVFVVLLLWFAYSIADILFLLFVAVLFSVYLGAVTHFLEERFRIGRAAGAVIALILTTAAAAGIGYLIVPPVLEQAAGLFAVLPQLVAAWEMDLLQLARRYPLLDQLLPPEAPGGYVGSVIGWFSGYFEGVVPYLFHGITFLIHFFSVLVMGLYMTLQPVAYREGFVALIPPVHRDLARDIFTDLGMTLRAWIVGQLISMLVLGLLTWIGLLALGVPYALAFGVFTGLAAIVPFFGTLVSTLLPALFVLGSGTAFQALLVVSLGLVIHLIEGNFIHPMIMQRQVHLPPVLSILSVLVMAKLLGFIGLLVAVPVLAVVVVIVRRIYVQRVLEGKGFRRTVREDPDQLPLLTAAEAAAEPLPVGVPPPHPRERRRRAGTGPPAAS